MDRFCFFSISGPRDSLNRNFRFLEVRFHSVYCIVCTYIYYYRLSLCIDLICTPILHPCHPMICLRHLQANSLENDVLLLEARPFAMELQRQLLTSQSLTKLEPRNLAKTSSSMGYLAVIDSVTSEVRRLSSGVLDGKDVEFPKGYSFG